jgi:tRNA A-37 threonylcarbamoyl transferase component Bud32
MVKGYEVYCLVDPLFYDSPSLHASDESLFTVAAQPVPDGWHRSQLDDWLVYMPEGIELPEQGWKIHASAGLQNAAEVVEEVWRYCIARRIAFKFVGGPELFFTRNLKYAHRGSSGKLVTIYPLDEAQTEQVLTELGERLDGQPGPYILSDLRWGAGPLFVRYGGFAERYCIGPSGIQELAIADGEGQLVPDRRGPTFQLPPWVELPGFLMPHLDARNSVKVDELPCTVEQALHFSNSGGVYLGTDRQTGEKVVLKEARPYAGLATDRSDGVTRLRRERDNLERLAGIPAVPGLRDYRVVGEHHFLMQDFVEGKSLHSCLAERNPLVLQTLERAAADEYADWVMAVCEQIEDAVAAVHDRGLAILDLHPSNVLVSDSGRVSLIDLEMAADGSASPRQTLADPAFLAPAGTTGFSVDRHALGCLRLYAFMPLTSLFALDPNKPAQLAEEIARLFPTAGRFVREAAEMITGARPQAPAAPGAARSRSAGSLRLDPTASGWERARRSMAAAILASATPDRDDRLFPGDVEQFASGGLNLAHGAAGVLYALHVTGAGRHPRHEEWLVDRALDPPAGTRLGFYDGLHGVAYALDILGRHDEALTVLDRCCEELRRKHRHFGLDLRSGLAGIGLNLQHFAIATGDAAIAAEASEVLEIVAQRLGGEDSLPTVSGGEHPYAGLIRGSSGLALLFMRSYDETGDPALLDLAATAIRQDLRRCITRPEDGALEVNEGWRSCPYVSDGGVGIAFALQDYLARREDEEFADALAATRRAAEAQFYVEPGLFYGRAGMLLFLCREHAPGTATDDPLVAAQIRRLSWHALPYKRHLAFPGERLVRLSMDLTTGTAGVLLAMGSALHSEPVHLPFLQSPRLRQASGSARPAADLDASRELLTTANSERR